MVYFLFLHLCKILSIPKSVCFIAVIGMRWKSLVKIGVLYRGIRVYGDIGW